jgi:hypothetical protein
MAVVSFLVFASAFAASIAVFLLTLVPALPRIVSILRDGASPVPAKPPVWTVSEARLRARVRAATVMTQPKWREAA